MSSEKEQAREQKAKDKASFEQSHRALEENKVAQAEARLKYLLSQSDMFAHFGVGKNAGGGSSTSPISPQSSSSSSASRRAKHAAGDEEEELMEGTSSGTVLTVQPSILQGQLKHYQLEGLNWLIRLQENGINGILADEMGLGKTFQSISILAYTKEFRNISGPHLIVVPKTTLSNWMNEFARWCPSFRVLKFHGGDGGKEERLRLVSDVLCPNKPHEAREWDVCVTTFEMIKYEKAALIKIPWQYFIIDEAHRLKNEDSQLAQCARVMKTHNRLLLTGTPLQNNLHELWALLNFLLPDVFASSEQFDEWFNLSVDDVEAKTRIISQLHKLLRPFMIRRMKIDVEKSLPPKTETILFTGLAQTQKDLYRNILKRDLDAVKGTGSRTAILNIVMQLRKCCNHPYLFPGIEDPNDDALGEHLVYTSGKMILLDKLLKKLQERGSRVLIFSQMTKMLDILEDYVRFRQLKYCRIDGNTTYEDREDQIAAFNAPESPLFLFLLSTRAGGLGINLQTADTVIIFDSDWNPQADLQAQDRAHRIGQKKEVQVFRLITDDTVEVKILERAQQKLKLDAIVVQQGRLQDKDKKLSKDEILETLRFGADKVFNATGNDITDDDIDVILKRGKERTQELNEKMKDNNKGDLYDFSMDGGMKTQQFEGKDYSEKAMRDAMALEGQQLLALMLVEEGKRERTKTINYSETGARLLDDYEKRPKLPKHLKPPRVEEWQLYHKTRLLQLYDEETRRFDEFVNQELYRQQLEKQNYQIVIAPNQMFLPMDKHIEKATLLEEGFPTWNKHHYNTFIKSSARFGRTEIDKIAREVGKSKDEVERYAHAFWTRGALCIGQETMERHEKGIKKGEEKLHEIQKLTLATSKLLSLFENPWEQISLKNFGMKSGNMSANSIGNSALSLHAVSSNSIYAEENRFLLCLVHLHGHGNWEAIRNSIRRCDRFRFDFALQSASIETISKRCEALMRAAEAELNDIENRKKDALAGTKKEAVPTNKQLLTSSLENLSAIELQIEEETKNLLKVRANLSKLKSGGRISNPKSKEATASNDSSMDVSNSKNDADESAKSKDKDDKRSHGNIGVSRPRPFVHNGLLPELCKVIDAAGPDGIAKIIGTFYESHIDIPKRQIERKIFQVAYKDKLEGSTGRPNWIIKPEFTKYLSMENFESTEGDIGDNEEEGGGGDNSMEISSPNDAKKGSKEKPASASKSSKAEVAIASSSSKSKSSSSSSAQKDKKEISKESLSKEKDSDGDASGKKRKAEKKESSTKESSKESSSKSSGKSIASASSASSPKPSKDDKSPATNKKAKTAEGSSASAPAASASAAPAESPKGDALKEPKKPKRAFQFFVKDVHATAVSQIEDPQDTDALKNQLMVMWKGLDVKERKAFEKKEEDDKARYDSEMEAWNASM